jgi:hypothetical protein
LTTQSTVTLNGPSSSLNVSLIISSERFNAA